VKLRDFAGQGNIEECRDLLGQGARVNCQDLTQKTPLINAAYSGEAACCLFLLENNANIHHRDRTGCTALLKVRRPACGGHGGGVTKAVLGRFCDHLFSLQRGGGLLR
jgi:hypothetical protein